MDDDKGHDWSSQKLKAFDLVALLLEYRLSKIWPLAPERGTFIRYIRMQWVITKG